VSRLQHLEPWERNLYGLWGILFAAFVGLSLILPFIPLYLRELGLTDTADVTRWSGLILAGPFMVSFLVTPLWGVLGDRYGQKLMVVRALLGSSVAYFGMAVAATVPGLFAWRLVLGGISGFLAAGMALVSVTVPDGRRGYALGLLQAVVPASGLIGPLLGGVLADLIGYRAIFFVTGTVCALGGVVAAALLVEARVSVPTHVAPGGVRDNVAIAWGSAPLRFALLAVVASQTLVTTLQPIFVLYVEGLGVEPRLLSSTTGVLYAATGITSLIAAPWWGRRSDRHGAVRVATLALVGSAVLLLVQACVTGVLPFLVARLLYGGFVAGVLPPLFGLITAASPPDSRGGMMGLTSSAAMLGNLCGPLAGGYIGAHVGLRAVFVVSALALLAVPWAVQRTRPHGVPTSPR
jgi:DHA1 family multidrug resistance protein-like MFS transporter